MSKMTVTADAKPMLNAYPDSVGGTLSDITGFLQKPELKDVFSSFCPAYLIRILIAGSL